MSTSLTVVKAESTMRSKQHAVKPWTGNSVAKPVLYIPQLFNKPELIKSSVPRVTKIAPGSKVPRSN